MSCVMRVIMHPYTVLVEHDKQMFISYYKHACWERAHMPRVAVFVLAWEVLS